MLARTMTVAATAARRKDTTNCRNASPTPPTITRPSLAQQVLEERNHARAVDEIVPGYEDHQRQHQRQSDPEAVFLSALAKRPPADRLRGIEHEMPAVENGDRKQVDQPEIHGKQRHEADEVDESDARHHPRHLRDRDRTAELVGGAPAHHHLPGGLERAGRNAPRLANRAPDRAHGIAAEELGARALDAKAS